MAKIIGDRNLLRGPQSKGRVYAYYPGCWSTGIPTEQTKAKLGAYFFAFGSGHRWPLGYIKVNKT